MDRKLLEDVRILVVDDNDQVRDVLQRMLRMYGATCVTAGSAADACSVLATTVFEVVITDMGRGLDRTAGYTLLDRLRKTGIQTPVLIYAGSAQPSGRAVEPARGRPGRRGARAPPQPTSPTGGTTPATNLAAAAP